MARAAALLLLAPGAAGHAWINEPPSRTGATLAAAGTCPYGSCLWFSQGCTIGCPKCGGAKGRATCGKDQGKATLPKAARTYFTGEVVPHIGCGTTPWCAPGSAPIMSPCGVAGGDVAEGSAGAGGVPPPGYKQGDRGESMPALKGDVNKRTWKAGDVVDVAWAIDANHGGGYQYRLCPLGQESSEECFQKTPLEFVGDESYIQYCHYPDVNPLPFLNATPAAYPPETTFAACDLTNRTAIPALRVSTGTVPAGSTWTRNPIPACKAPVGGAFNMGCGPKQGTGHDAADFQFPPAGPDLARPGYLLGGFGIGSCDGCGGGDVPGICGKGLPGSNCTPDRYGAEGRAHLFQFSIVDKVRVPQVPPGEYVVSFRWDCEQTQQIWSQCSDVTVTA